MAVEIMEYETLKNLFIIYIIKWIREILSEGVAWVLLLVEEYGLDLQVLSAGFLCNWCDYSISVVGLLTEIRIGLKLAYVFFNKAKVCWCGYFCRWLSAYRCFLSSLLFMPLHYEMLDVNARGISVHECEVKCEHLKEFSSFLPPDAPWISSIQ